MLGRTQVLTFRVRAQELDRARSTLADAAVLDIGVQDTGTDGALWALANRGVSAPALDQPGPAELVMLWTIRGAPHFYRRQDLPAVAAAVRPFSEADAAKRIYEASKPLRAAGIGSLAGLEAVAAAMRSIVTRPMAKGLVSTELTARLDEPYLRYCRGCGATHPNEMTFRLAALGAGLELRPGTSPPVLERIPRFRAAAQAPPRFDVIRAYLRLLGPATPKHVADYLDSSVKEVTARWPADAVEVTVEGEKRWVLEPDADRLDGDPARLTRLLGPYDLFLQAKDRPLLVADPARAKALWPVLGRPGAVLHDGEIAGLWRPRKSGSTLGVLVQLWGPGSAKLRDAVTEQAHRLAEFRGATLGAVTF